MEQDRDLGTDQYQKTGILMRNNFQNPIAEDMEEFGKVGAEISHIQSQMHSKYNSAESIADQDLEDGELLHHCICRVEEIVKHHEYQLLR